jgi:hypothetical protein
MNPYLCFHWLLSLTQAIMSSSQLLTPCNHCLILGLSVHSWSLLLATHFLR